MSAQVTKAMVLAAGLGTRMAPLTGRMPKPLVPVAGKPLIDHALDWLCAAHIEDVVVNTHYKADMLEAYLRHRRHPRLHISHENTLLETGGGVKKVLPLLGPQLFFVLNSDAITVDGRAPGALARLRQAWDDMQMDALLLLQPREKAVGYDGAGDFFLENEGRLRRRLREKRAPYVYTGVQLLHPRLFAAAPDGAFSFNVLYDREMSSDGSLDRVRGLVHDGGWLHVGDPTAILLAEHYLGYLPGSA